MQTMCQKFCTNREREESIVLFAILFFFLSCSFFRSCSGLARASRLASSSGAARSGDLSLIDSPVKPLLPLSLPDLIRQSRDSPVKSGNDSIFSLSSSGKRSAFRGSLDSPVKPGNDEREKKHENDEREKSRGMTRKEDDRKMTGRIWQGRREEMRKTDMIKKEKTGEIPPFQNIDVLS